MGIAKIRLIFLFQYTIMPSMIACIIVLEDPAYDAQQRTFAFKSSRRSYNNNN